MAARLSAAIFYSQTISNNPLATLNILYRCNRHFDDVPQVVAPSAIDLGQMIEILVIFVCGGIILTFSEIIHRIHRLTVPNDRRQRLRPRRLFSGVDSALRYGTT
jgi:hypothetical protein